MLFVRLLVVSLVVGVALALVGCSDLSSEMAPLGPDASTDGALELGRLEVLYDLQSGEATGSFEPTTEAGARFDATVQLSAAYGKSVYDNRQDIRELRPTGSSTVVGRGMIVSVALRNTSSLHFMGPRLVGTWAAGANGIYARDVNGVRIATEVTPYDPDVVLGPGRNFLTANDSSQVVPPDYAFTQSTEFRSLGYQMFTQLAAVGKTGVWRFVEVPQGATRAGNADPYAYGPAYVSSSGARVQPSAQNMVALGMVFTVPSGAASVRIYGTVYADCAIVTNSAGADRTDISSLVSSRLGGVARDSQGRLYVADGTQVRRLKPNGTLDVANLLQTGIPRAQLAQIAVVDAPYRKIYVVDTSGSLRIYDNTVSPAPEVTRIGLTNAFGVAVDSANNRLYVSTNKLGTPSEGSIKCYALTSAGTPTSTTPTASVNINLGIDTVGQIYDAGGQLQVDGSGKVYIAAKTLGILRYPANLSGIEKVFQTPSKLPWRLGTFCQLAVLADGTVVGYERSGAIPGADGAYGAQVVVGDNGPYMFTRSTASAGVSDQCGLVRFSSAGAVTAASRLRTYFGPTQSQIIRSVAGGMAPVALTTDGGAGSTSKRFVMLYDPQIAVPGSGSVLRFDM